MDIPHIIIMISQLLLFARVIIVTGNNIRFNILKDKYLIFVLNDCVYWLILT